MGGLLLFREKIAAPLVTYSMTKQLPPPPPPLPSPQFVQLPPREVTADGGLGCEVQVVDPNAAFEPVIALVLDGLRSPNSKRQYRCHLINFLSWCRAAHHRFTKATLNTYRQHLQDKGYASATINSNLCAVRKLAVESADAGLLSQDIAAAITRAPGMPRQSHKTGRWLTKPESELLITTPDPLTAVGSRDRAILGLLIGCGLRRSEVAGLAWPQFQIREGRYVLLDVFGKGMKNRTCPVPAWAAHLIELWRSVVVRSWSTFTDVTGTDDLPNQFLFPAMRKGRGGLIVGSKSGLSPQSIRLIVIRHATTAGLSGVDLEDLAAHDLRRTFAKLARKNGADLEQIQFTLGHASLTTTELYLGGKQNLQDAPCDVLGINIADDSNFAIRQVAAKPKEQPPLTLTDTANK